MARLSHPHVVTVIDFGEDSGTPYIVLELVEGETLKERIKRLGRLPVDEAVAYAIEIGRALSSAHSERLVHRDMKPQNVLIDDEGRAKVTDFGIARSLEADGLTATGRVLGTTDYVSPEQALGKEVTEQSDVYSLGHRAVRDAHRRGALQGRDPGGGGHEARAGADARRAAAQARGVRLTGGGAGPRDGEGDRRPLSPVESMVHDLEEVLAIEVARSGGSSGEATTVLRALPGDTAEFAPSRLRNPRRWVLTVLAVVLLAGGVVAFFATRTEKGAGTTAPRAGGLPRGARRRRRQGLRPPGRRAGVTRGNPQRDRRQPHHNWDTEPTRPTSRASKDGRGAVCGRRRALPSGGWR